MSNKNTAALLIFLSALVSCQNKQQVFCDIPSKALPVIERYISDLNYNLKEVPVKQSSFPALNVLEANVDIVADGQYLIGCCETSFPREIAYDTFEFEHYMDTALAAGLHALPNILKGKKAIAFIKPDGTQDERASIKDIRRSPTIEKEYRLTANPNAAFTKHPYTEWHYANGATLDGLWYLAKACGNDSFAQPLTKFCSWTLDNMELFRSQYEAGSLRTQNYRLFRRAMLDDTSAPSLPFLDLANAGIEINGSRALIDDMARYTMTEQYRLDDGTFCRSEPKWTVWCDDMFMSGSFLVRYYDLTGDKSYLDEAIKQAKQFYVLLNDGSTGLLWHAYNATEDRHLGAHWGRANGWYIWALSDILERLGPDTEDFRSIQEIHNNLLKAICRLQDESGLWHQVLDHKETYLETSCSCIFTFALARSVRKGWLGQEYLANALNGWNGIETRVDAENGTVHGICRSMSIQPSVADYNSRATADNDPRGLGAFFMAAAEVGLLNANTKQ